MRPIAQARCFVHGGREAAARCRGCGRAFCRECVTEHGGLFQCASCLAAAAAATGGKQRSGGSPVSTVLAALAGLAIAYWALSAVGAHVSRWPSTFHDGSAIVEGVSP